jgi:tetratricopeptide (TPR) repeat protein
LETGEFDRLSSWTRKKERTPAERDFFMVALEHYLRDGRQPVPPSLVEKLFPEGYRGRLWQAASAFAQRGLFREAIQLGKRVLSQQTEARAGYAVELARWEIESGDLEGARKALRNGLSGSGEGYTAPEYAAVRAAYLLVPPAERSAFVAEVQSGLNELQEPVHTTLVRSLLAGLSGDEKEAHTQLNRLLTLRAISPAFGDDRATAATRYWDFLLMAGTQLVAWHLDELASHLWQQALADEAAIALQTQLPPPQGESIRARVNEVRTRLTGIRLMRTGPEEFDSIVSGYLRYAPADGLLPLAETLEAMGGNSVAVLIYRKLWEQEPANPHALRNALSACRGAGDWIGLEEILSRVVSEGQFRQNDAAHRDLVQQYAEVLERRQDFDHARSALAGISESGPNDARLLLRLASLQERCGQAIAAEATYRKLLSTEPTNIAARLSLAALLDANGKTTESIDLLERASGAEVDSRLAELNLKAGRLEEALGALERVPPPEHARTAQVLADQLEAKGDPKRARYVIRAAFGRTAGDQTKFALQSRLIRLLPADSTRALIEREVRRLRRLADAETVGTAEYYDVMSREADRLKLGSALQSELHDAWNSSRGELAAGIALLGCGTATEVEGIWPQILQHPSLDAGSLARAVSAFEKRGEERRRVEALGHLARIDAEEPRKLGEWGRALGANGRREEALQVAEELAARAVFKPEVLPQAAELFATLNEPKTARELYRKATAADPTARAPEVHIRYTLLLIGMRDFDEAHASLRTCSRNSSAPIVPVILEYLKATDAIGTVASIADLTLSARQWLELRRAIFSELLLGGNTAGALKLAEDHPQVFGEEQSRLLRKNIKESRDFERAAALLEGVRAQGGDGDFASELAELLSAWAETELISLQLDKAVVHLAKAQGLAPAKWSIAERLAGLYLDRLEPAKAAQTVKAFLAVSKESGERDKANQLLSRIPVP